MAKYRRSLTRKRSRRLHSHQQEVRIVRVLHGPMWANAWPRLDDWFKSGAFFIG